MHPTEKKTLYCSNCHTEFEIVLEPQAKHDTEYAAVAEAKQIGYCPFCRDKLNENPR